MVARDGCARWLREMVAPNGEPGKLCKVLLDDRWMRVAKKQHLLVGACINMHMDAETLALLHGQPSSILISSTHELVQGGALSCRGVMPRTAPLHCNTHCRSVYALQALLRYSQA